MSRGTYEKLREVQNLLRHTIRDGDPAAIFDRALTLLRADLSKTKFALTECPRPGRKTSAGSRHLPAAVKREVWRRDEGQCAFIGERGRCRETGFLEFHHVVPYARREPATTKNIELRCRAHNAYEAEQLGLTRPEFLVRETKAEMVINRDSVRTESYHRLAAGISAYNPRVLDTHVPHARHPSWHL